MQRRYRVIGLVFIEVDGRPHLVPRLFDIGLLITQVSFSQGATASSSTGCDGSESAAGEYYGGPVPNPHFSTYCAGEIGVTSSTLALFERLDLALV